MSLSNPHKVLADRLSSWNKNATGKTKNKDIIWFPKPRTDLMDMRKILKFAYKKQLKNKSNGTGDFFIENRVAVELADLGTITRPGVGSQNTVSEYKEESTPNQPHVSSFRMLNRIYRLLGFVTRDLSNSNGYKLTDVGIQFTKFDGIFPSTIGNLSEKDFVVERLMNVSVFSIHDNLNMWDTRFRNRIVVNLLRCASIFGYITNYEAVVTAFSLKDERNPEQIKKIIQRLHKLHEDKIDMVDAYKECSIDPFNSSATNNAYDSPKVLTSLCRQTGLFESKTLRLIDTPFGDLRPLYKKMFNRKSSIKKPSVVNILTNYGKEILIQERKKRLVGFEELY